MIPRTKLDPDIAGGILAYLSAHPGATLRSVAYSILGGRHGTDREVAIVGATLVRLQLDGCTTNHGDGFAVRSTPATGLLATEGSHR